MNILKSILLGLVQGLTEFLPVSSSGHLAIFGKILGTNLDSEIYFNVLLHLGTLIAIIIVFHEDIWHMIQEFFQMLLIIFANFIVFIKRRRGDTKYTYFKVVNSNYKKTCVNDYNFNYSHRTYRTSRQEFYRACNKYPVVCGNMSYDYIRNSYACRQEER